MIVQLSNMILLNGIPPILGLSIFHITAINLFAIGIEFIIIQMRYKDINKLMLRTTVANLISLIVGIIVLYTIPGLMDGNIMRTDSDMTNYDRLTLITGLTGLFLANVLIEFPAYLIGRKINKTSKIMLFKTVLFANFLSNIPVFIIYSLLML